MNTRRLGWFALAALVLAVSGYAVANLGSVDDGVASYAVELGRFLHRVDAEGVLTAEQATVLNAPRATNDPMKIAWIAADGLQVEEGEVVVRFDPTDMENELFTGEADRAKAETEALQRTLEQGAALENLERDAALAQLQLRHAQEFQTDDEEIFSRAEIIESQIDGELASERKEHAEELRGLRAVQGEVDLDLLELQKRQAQLIIERARAGLRELEIRAPHSGIFVLSRNRGEPPAVGQVVWPGYELGEIPRLDSMRARVYVLEADAGGVQVGMPAEVVLEAHPGSVVEATVERIAAVAQQRARWSPVQYFDIDLGLAYTDPDKMKPGQRVRATILLQDLDDVVAVPREAVFRTESGDAYVYRRAGGDWERVDVVVGPAALGRVVIEQGLESGDRIALQDPEQRLSAPLDSTAPAGPGVQSGGFGR